MEKARAREEIRRWDQRSELGWEALSWGITRKVILSYKEMEGWRFCLLSALKARLDTAWS